MPHSTQKADCTAMPFCITNYATILLKPLTVFFAVISFLLSLRANAQDASSNPKLDLPLQYLLQTHSADNAARQIQVPEIFSVNTLPVYQSDMHRSSELLYDCIIHTDSVDLLRKSGVMIRTVLPGFVTAGATIAQIELLSQHPSITFIQTPGADKIFNDITVANSGASLLHQGALNNTPYTGKGVIVAIYDTGIDWDHPDFRNPTDPKKSRILAIWDQTIPPITGESSPSAFPYGVEYTQAQINDELDGTPTGFVRQRDFKGHGTHVAGTAVGNGRGLASLKHKGMAPDADIVIIKGGNGTFSESSIIDGLTYLKNLSTTLGKPVVVNMSLGSQSGPHDGTRLYEKAVDDFTNSGNGRVAVIAAGNSNGEAIHVKRQIAGLSVSDEIVINVPNVTTSSQYVFEMALYANDNIGNLILDVTSPKGITNSLLFVNVLNNTIYHWLGDSLKLRLINGKYPSNNQSYLNISVTRETRNGVNPGNPAGSWKIKIRNQSQSPREIHGWLVFKEDGYESMNITGGNSDYMVTSPGNATTAITVGSFSGKTSWYSAHGAGAPFLATAPTQGGDIAIFSSRGPRRDGLIKPDLTANGQYVISTTSSDMPTPTISMTTSGLYRADHGTSMASPAVAGAAALLLQAKPDASAAMIKTLLQNAASKDGFTEQFFPTPNATFGYGKLDVFKAAAALFGCAPAERTTYQYDEKELRENANTYNLQNRRAGVRFTNTGTKKLGGVYLFTGTILTSLRVEIRNSNGNMPGNTILTTKDISNTDGNISRFSWNYIDLSDTNLTLEDGTDYFVLIYSITNGDEWTLRYDNMTAASGRTVLSDNNGASWFVHSTLNLRIRPVAFSDAQLMTGSIVQNHATDTRNIETSMQFQANCEAINTVIPNGSEPISGLVTSKVWRESSVPEYNGLPYVQRHYEITPQSNAGTATGRVTLYFTQAEFDAYNAKPGAFLPLPTNANDAVGKANLRVEKFPGISSDHSGLPETYTELATLIKPLPADIVWKPAYNRWEVSFNVSGFSGFIVHTVDDASLPIRIEYFKARKQNEEHLLDWKLNCSGESVIFEVERSGDGLSFEKLTTITTTESTCTLAYQYKDKLPLQGINYYRIKIAERNTDKTLYTEQLLLENNINNSNTIYPNVLNKAESITLNYLSDEEGQISVFDASGRKTHTQTIRKGKQKVSVIFPAAGIYFYTIQNQKNTIMNKGRLSVL